MHHADVPEQVTTLRSQGRRRERVRACGFVAACLSIAIFAAPAVAAPLQVSVEGGQLTADLGQVAVADVLAEVARQAGAQLSVRGDLGTVLPQRFSSLPLAQALPRVAYPNGLILQFAPDPSSSAGRRLVAIRAVAPGQPAPAAAAASRVAARPGRDTGRGAPAGLWSYDKGAAALPAVEERTTAIGKISQQRGKGATDALVYVLTADPDPAVRRAALGMLANLGDDSARAALTQAAADADPDVRADALQGLVRLGPEKPVNLLAQAARSDSDARVRIAALGQLSMQDGVLAQAALRGALADPDINIRTAAQQALRR